MKKILAFILVALVGVIIFLTAAPLSNYYGQQIVRLYNEIKFYNTSGTLKWTISNNGAMTVTGTAIAKIVRKFFIGL